MPSKTKPPLEFSQSVSGIGEQSIAFTFPGNSTDWTISIKVAPFAEISINFEGLTPVGLVEIGASGQTEPGIYEVKIAVGSIGNEVSGLLSSINTTTEYPVIFQGVVQKLNPARNELAYKEFNELNSEANPPPDNSAAISADGVCFVVKTDIPNDDPDEGEVYIRYCSQPDSVLSVKKNFASQYEILEASIKEAAAAFPDLPIQSDQTISEIEDPVQLEHCNEQIKELATATPTETTQEAPLTACSSDITIAPVPQEYFDAQKAKSPSALAGSGFLLAPALASVFQQDNGSPISVAVVQVLEPIETSLSTVEPGTYRMDYWFDANGVFYAATITGTKDAGGEVINQQVPAVPATFVNADDTEQPGAQISACRIFGRCSFFQKTCP